MAKIQRKCSTDKLSVPMNESFRFSEKKNKITGNFYGLPDTKMIIKYNFQCMVFWEKSFVRENFY